MQGHPTYYPTTTKPTISRQSVFMLLIVVFFLLLGAAVGYFAAKGAVSEATLNIQVQNDTTATQNIRIFVNEAFVAEVNLSPGQVTTIPWKVGWTNTMNGVYEVRATPTLGFGDTDRVIVGNGQTILVDLRVR